MRPTPYQRRAQRARARQTQLITIGISLGSLLLCVLIGIIALQNKGEPYTSDRQSATVSDISPTRTEEQETIISPFTVTVEPTPVLTASPEPTTVPTPMPTPCFPLEKACFDGSVDYAFFDERLAIQIQEKKTDTLTYFVCDIQTTEANALRAALSGDKVNGRYEHTSDIAIRNGAILAINGDDYGVHKNGIIIRNGQLIRTKATTRHLLMLDNDGNLRVESERKKVAPKAMADSLISSEVQQTWEFGPELVREGYAVAFPNTFNLISVKDDQLEPRTGIGQIGPLHYVVIVVDGRRAGYSDGVCLSDFQEMFMDTGAWTAFNLDGGGSTTLFFCGKVLNRPSGGSERSVSDILYFK